MEFGVHVPILDFSGNPFVLTHLLDYTEAAAGLGFTTIAVNDHMIFAAPWLDGPTALAAVMDRSGSMTLATTVALPAVRGPVPLAKSLAAIDVLSGGRVVAGVGPGSSARDYEAMGVEFDDRWVLLDEAIGALRALWCHDAAPFVGSHYSTTGVHLEPRPTRAEGIPIWVGSWGSAAGLGRVARLADGWLASAYNTTPAMFGDAWRRLQEMLELCDKDPAAFPNAIATMWFHVTEDRDEAERVLRQRLVPRIGRPEELLRARLAFGPAEDLAAKLRAFAAAGAQRVYLWPVVDEIEQLERFWTEVRPSVA